MKSVHVIIELEGDRRIYTNGDEVVGTVLIHNLRKDISLRSVTAKLRCEELAVVWVSTTQGGYYKTERQKNYSEDCQLFPGPNLAPNNNYKVTTGTHKFDFCFMIPLSQDLPGTLRIKGSASRIFWYVKVTINRAEIMASNTRTSKEIYMVPSRPHASPTEMDSHEIHETLYLRSPGLKNAAQRMLKKDPVQRQTPLSFTLMIPASGLRQAPYLLRVRLMVGLTEPEQLLLVEINAYLRETTEVTIDRGWHRSMIKTNRKICSATPNLLVTGPSFDLSEYFESAVLLERLTETFRSSHFSHSFEFVVDLEFRDINHPDTSGKVSISAPVVVWGLLNRDEYADDLPRYLPRYEDVLASDNVNPEK